MTDRTKLVGSASALTEPRQYFFGSTPGVSKAHHMGIDYYYHQGEDTVDFHKRKKRGELIPYTRWTQTRIVGTTTSQEDKCKYSDGRWNFTPEGSFREFQFYMASALTDLPSLLDLDRKADLYVDACASTIYREGWDTLTFLAELHKVVRMFRTFVPSLLKLADSPKELSKTWLEGRYGWRILMYDLMDINEILTSVDVNRTRFKARTGGSLAWSKSHHTTNVSSGWGTRNYLYEDSAEISLRGSIIADIKPPKFAFNPIVTAWELIPFSFVIDWVVTIGTWLESLSFLVLQKAHTASYGYHIDFKRTLTDSYISNYKSGWSQADISAEASMKGYMTVRVPTTVSKLPSLDLDLSWLKVADLLALFHRFLLRR
jgi:hypothetical protein